VALDFDVDTLVLALQARRECVEGGLRLGRERLLVEAELDGLVGQVTS